MSRSGKGGSQQDQKKVSRVITFVDEAKLSDELTSLKAPCDLHVSAA